MVTSRSAPAAPRGRCAARLSAIVARDAEVDRLAARRLRSEAASAEAVGADDLARAARLRPACTISSPVASMARRAAGGGRRATAWFMAAARPMSRAVEPLPGRRPQIAVA